MAFPVVEATATFQNGTATTSHNVTLPSGVTAGDLLVVWVGAVAAVNEPSGWNTLFTAGSTRALWTTAAGGETTVTVTCSSSRMAAVSYRISGWTSVEGTGNNTNGDPPSETASWGSADNLWLALWSSRRSDWSVTGAPTNYATLVTAQNASNTATSRVGVSSARRSLASATDDPGTFTVSGTTNTLTSGTVVVQPASAGPNDGASTGTIGWAGSATGITVRSGAASGSIAWAGSATGARSPKGEATGSIAWAGTAAGVAPLVVMDGAGTGTITWAGTAAGTSVHSGSSTGTVGWSGTSSGVSTHSGSASGTVGWVGTATGREPAGGAATGSITWTGSATGVSPAVGTQEGEATGTISWTGTAQGAVAHRGASSGVVSWTGTATGAKVSNGATSVNITWAGTATGESPAPGIQEGSADGTISWTGSATGITTRRGAGSGTITWTGTGNGTTGRTGAANGTVTWTGTATGFQPSTTFFKVSGSTSNLLTDGTASTSNLIEIEGSYAR